MAEQYKIYDNIRTVQRCDTINNWQYYSTATLATGELGCVFDNNFEHPYIVLGGATSATGEPFTMRYITKNRDKENIAPYIFISKQEVEEIVNGGVQIPVASTTEIGGIKMAPLSGLMLDQNNALRSAIFTWNYDKGCYSTDHLYVNTLEFGNKIESSLFDSDTITLRASATTYEFDFAGITVPTDTDSHAMLGVNSSKQLVISDKYNIPTVALPLQHPNADVAYCAVSCASDDTLGTLVPLNSLQFINSKTENTLSYNGSELVEVDITPPDIIVNGQNAFYDIDNNQFNIHLDGGLTEENLSKINSIDALARQVSELQSSVDERLTIEVSGNNKINVQTQTQGTQKTFIVQHDTYQAIVPGTASYSVKAGDSSRDTLSCITSLSVDDYGHLVGYTVSTIRFV